MHAFYHVWSGEKYESVNSCIDKLGFLGFFGPGRKTRQLLYRGKFSTPFLHLFVARPVSMYLITISMFWPSLR